MTINQRRLDDLAPLHQDLQREAELDEALKIITPAHAEAPRKRLRAGINKRGEACYFQALGGKEDPGAWFHHEKLSSTQTHELLSIGEDKLEYRRGPAGCLLIFHVDEKWKEQRALP